VQRHARPDHEPQCVEERHEDGHHGQRLPENTGNLKRCNRYGVSGRHRGSPPTSFASAFNRRAQPSCRSRVRTAGWRQTQPHAPAPAVFRQRCASEEFDPMPSTLQQPLRLFRKLARSFVKWTRQDGRSRSTEPIVLAPRRSTSPTVWPGHSTRGVTDRRRTTRPSTRLPSAVAWRHAAHAPRARCWRCGQP
jgi:hypothetical protein